MSTVVCEAAPEPAVTAPFEFKFVEEVVLIVPPLEAVDELLIPIVVAPPVPFVFCELLTSGAPIGFPELLSCLSTALEEFTCASV